MRATKICDQVLPQIASDWLDRFGEAADQANAKAAEEQRKRQRAEEAATVAVLEKQQAERVAADARQRVLMAARSLMRAVPGIVLSSLGFAFASEADGDDRVALMGLLLFVAGTAAYVWAIGLASGRLKPDSRPGTQDQLT